jgi:hypothetical protein
VLYREIIAVVINKNCRQTLWENVTFWKVKPVGRESNHWAHYNIGIKLMLYKTITVNRNEGV